MIKNNSYKNYNLDTHICIHMRVCVYVCAYIYLCMGLSEKYICILPLIKRHLTTIEHNHINAQTWVTNTKTHTNQNKWPGRPRFNPRSSHIKDSPLHLGVVAIEMRFSGSPSTAVANTTLLYIYIYIYIYIAK